MSVTSMSARVAVWTLAAVMMMAPLGLATAQDEAAVELKVGDAAPDFSLPGSDGQTYTLSQFKGEKEVVLAFFFKAFTPG